MTAYQSVLVRKDSPSPVFLSKKAKQLLRGIHLQIHTLEGERKLLIVCNSSLC
ncbi:hypothetical protein DPMN_099245 [Dreissena polymorpha]|uniref:Uncharacterized protein n=1 Tax=Dreissena polymorpha TaxID=45954 RepID=A0A9D4LF86_DREPO|nr:hypothetical protein DPMN_099245 [Dreissena polymorpha]